MTIESGTYISDLNVNYPEQNAFINGGDNHIRWTKEAIKNSFPAITGAITASHTTINTSIASVVAATSSNTANTLVKRDASGNISAGAITGTSFSTTGNMNFGDNDRAIFGASADLQIFHNGSNSYIDDVGTGSLYVRGNNLYLDKYTGEHYLAAIADGAVNLYYNNSQKLATTNTGIDVSGTATMNGLNVDSGTLQVDASNNRVGVNTSPSHSLHINSGSTDCVSQFESSDSAAYISLKDSTTSHALHGIGAVGNELLLYANNAERLRINSAGLATFQGSILTDEIRCRTAQQLVLNAGESGYNATGQTDEYVYVNAENGLQINSSPDNWNSGWAGRKTATIKGDSITVDGAINAGNATFDNGTSTTVNIACDNTGTAELKLMGWDQGTGRLYVGQSSTDGGGIEYNGDSNPVTAGAGNDYTALFRRENSTDHWTARNHATSNNWEFRGNVKSNGNLEASGNLVGEIKTHLFNEIYPIGAIYISTTSTSPATLFGGTWSAIGSGRVLQTVNGSSPSAATNYGSNSRSLTVNNMPAHTHKFRSDSLFSTDDAPQNLTPKLIVGDRTSSVGGLNEFNPHEDLQNHEYLTTEGSGTAFDVQQASYGVYMWRRTGLG